MTSLAEQLKRLALPQNDPSLLDRSEVASLLFTCKEAATIDRDTFFAIGCTGLEELMGIDPSFEEFQTSLFSSTSKALERSVQTKAVNQQLNKNISLFLIHLSPYFMLKPAQKCLEWLIHRFHIHLYNQDSLIGCVLPYHETNLFVRVIQLLDIKSPTHKWHWMDPIRVFSECPGNSAQLRVLLVFYASTIVSALGAAAKITDTMVSLLLPYVQKGLKSSVQDYRAATYMIICQMTVKVTVETSLVHSLMVQISKTLFKVPSLVRDGLACLNLLLQTQSGDKLGKKPFNYLCKAPELVTLLQSLSTGYDISPLLQYLLPHLVHTIVKSDTEEQEESEETENDIYIEHLQVIIESIPLEKDLDSLLASKFLEEFISRGTEIESNPTKMAALNQKILPLVRLLERKYPKALDSVLEKHLEDCTDEAAQNLFHQFISLSLSCGKYKEGFDQAFIEEAIFGRLKDDNRDVVMSALSSLEIMVQIFREQVNPEVVVSSLLNIFQKDDLSKDGKWYKVLERAVKILVKEEILKEKKELLDAAVMQLLPFMIITNANSKSSDWKMAVCLSESDLCSLHPLLKGWPEALGEAIKSTKSAELVGVANEKIILLLSGNLTSGDPSSLLQMVDDLILVAETESDSVRQKVTTLIIGSALVQCCCNTEMKENYFPVALRVFCFLDKKIQNLRTCEPAEETPLNWSVETAEEILVPKDLLSAYIEKLNSDETAHAEESAMVLFLLKNFINGLKAPLSFSEVVISLLINLGSPVSEVRRAALNCLHSLRGVKESLFHPVLQHLEQKTEEIVSDPTYIAQMVLSHLLPALDRLLEKVFNKPEAMLKDEVILLHLILGKFNEYSATLLCKNQQSLDLFIKSLHASKKIYEEIPPFQITALGQITKPFFAAVSDGMVQQKLLKVLFDLLLNCKNPLCAQTISSVFKGITVCAEQIVRELEPPEKSKSLATVQQTRRQKMQQQRKPQDAELAPEARPFSWQRVMLILELLQHKKKLRRPQALVPALFNLLSRCLEPMASEEENMEYTKQLILSCLLNICQKLSPDGSKVPADILDKEKFNVELIVQCIRISKMPQTHHHALLLLGAVAGMFPDKVLHNIMPIFTFMGANVLRLDDTYTFQVINKTVQMVIPALIQAEDSDLSESSGSVEEVVIKIIRVFVDALPHVPEHRRLPILSQLITTVGGDKFLWVLLVLLFEQYVTKTVTATSSTEKDAVLEADTEFWISICCEFNVRSQFQSVMKIIQYLTELPENKEDDPETKKLRTCKTKPKNQDGQLFNVESHSDKQLRHFKFLSVSFMSQLLSSQSFVKKIVEYEETEELQDLEQRLLEEVLHYINTVASSVEGNVDKPTAKFWRVLLSKCYDMLDKVNALLPTETFIPVIGGLMVNQLPSVRRKAMDLLNNKVQQRTKWQKSQILQLLELVPELIAIVKCRRKEEEEEQAINRQTALFSLKLLCKGFGTENPAPLMPALLKTLKSKKELVSNEIYLLSAVTALLKVAETLPHFLSPYLLECLLQVVRLEKIVAEFGPTSQISVRVAALKTILATRLAPRILLPAVTKCYSEVLHTRKNCLGPLMNILKEHISGMEKEHLISHQPELTAFFMKVLDFRTEHAEDDLEEVGKIEAHIIDCLISMVMKLSEASFRPLFFKLFDWSKTETTLRDRLLTFHRIADCIADKLKGLFTLFAGHLVKPFAETLNQVNISKTDEAFFDSDNNTEKSCLLLQFTMDCLHKLFLFDTQKFLSKERAETLMQPLVDQLENVLGGDEKFQERVTAHLIPCIAQFSVAMADDSLWKPLNYQILLKTRHSSPKVRFAALLALIEVAQKLKENYLVLLPESIPFLAELMEDECEEVEQQCQKTIQQLEVILGEPLQSYF
ncbi:hypothetical protein DUI87_10292 [Hirundo rustica rustica]|uniref:HEAT repeat-containing protein 1 n=1 Tax=Hirundo rustica rustica TaxID=333673 RepID=A0A3M0L040_HIRRU|nr:hypothetical protein DUI87_10292 [Hirundo rustica rustica]